MAPSPAPHPSNPSRKCEPCQGTGLDDPRLPGDWCPSCEGSGKARLYRHEDGAHLGGWWP